MATPQKKTQEQLRSEAEATRLKKETDAKAAAKALRAEEFKRNAGVQELPVWHPDIVEERFAEAVQGADIELIATCLRKVATNLRNGKDLARSFDAVADELEELAQKAESEHSATLPE